MKKLLSVILVMSLFFGAFGGVAEVYAASSSKPGIRKTNYKGKGSVSVTFNKDVTYKNLKITVTNSDGDAFTAKITSKSKREVNFNANKIKENGKYKYKIAGVKAKNGQSASLSGTFIADDFKDSSASGEVKVTKVKYLGDGRVELTFRKKVRYGDVTVKMKDSSGKSLNVKIADKDSGSLILRAGSIKDGKAYTVTVSGIKYSEDKSQKYTKAVCRFETEKKDNPVTLKKYSYDGGDDELTVYFKEQVKFKNEKVTITDSKGKKYSAKVLDTGKDKIVLRVRGLKKSKKYSVTVSGVRNRDGDEYRKVKGSFSF